MGRMTNDEWGVSYIRIYWNGVAGFDGCPAFYAPPEGYDYKWTEK